MIPFDQTWVRGLLQGKAAKTQFNMMVPAGSGLPKNTMGTWLADATCGCGMKTKYICAGLRLYDTRVLVPKTSPTTAPVKCPRGQVPVQKVDSTPENKCTQKYGDAASHWEQNGLLCYPDCRNGYYGVGPVCWTRCPSDMRDDGVDCAKHTYTPHTRAILPWEHCHHDEKHYGFECIDKCRSGYKLYNAVVMYYCGQVCPPHMTDAGLTCTKHSYGRTAGKPAVSAAAFAEIVGSSVLLGGLLAASFLIPGGEGADPLIITALEDEGAAAAAEGSAAAGEAAGAAWVPSLEAIEEGQVANWVSQGAAAAQRAALTTALINAGLL